MKNIYIKISRLKRKKKELYSCIFLSIGMWMRDRFFTCMLDILFLLISRSIELRIT